MSETFEDRMMYSPWLYAYTSFSLPKRKTFPIDDTRTIVDAPITSVNIVLVFQLHDGIMHSGALIIEFDY